MAYLLAIPLLILPWLEWWLMIRLRVPLGVWVFWCAGMAGVGWLYVRRESLDLWMDIQSDLANGRLPTEEGLDAMLLLLGGWGLIIPGVITDIVGVLLLLPQTRQELVPMIRQFLAQRMGKTL